MMYFDNAATTFPKPKVVVKQMTHMMNNYAANPGRGGHRLSRMAGKMVKDTRENLSDFFGVYESKRLIFTFNDTLAINMALHGTLKPGDHIITTSYEHNAVTRPLTKMSKCGVEVTILNGNVNGEISFDELVKSIRPNTKMVAACFSSNVIGNIMPVTEIGKICRENDILFLVDAAQGAGLVKIDVEKMYIDLLAVPGHKSLYGPMGTGLLYIGERAEVEDIFQGGTGTVSEDLEQPKSFPERYESGTVNAVGICGLNAGVNFIRKKGMDTIRKHEEKLTKIILEGLSEIKGVKILGEDIKERLPVVAFNIKDVRSFKVATILDKKYDIATRGGLHCAGVFHKLAGTIKQGAVRVSPGYFNTKEEAYKFIKAVRNVARELSY